MGKAMAIFLAIVLLCVAGTCLVLLILHVRDNVAVQRWELARRRARWEEHTEIGRDCAEDGTPIAVVTIRLMARRGRRSEELDYQLVALVPVHEVADPALLDAQGKAVQLAEVRNSINAAQQ